MTIKKTAILNFINKKFASTFKFLAKKSRPKFFIAKSSNWQDSYTTYLKIRCQSRKKS